MNLLDELLMAPTPEIPITGMVPITNSRPPAVNPSLSFIGDVTPSPRFSPSNSNQEFSNNPFDTKTATSPTPARHSQSDLTPVNQISQVASTQGLIYRDPSTGFQIGYKAEFNKSQGFRNLRFIFIFLIFRFWFISSSHLRSFLFFFLQLEFFF